MRQNAGEAFCKDREGRKLIRQPRERRLMRGRALCAERRRDQVLAANPMLDDLQIGRSHGTTGGPRSAPPRALDAPAHQTRSCFSASTRSHPRRLRLAAGAGASTCHGEYVSCPRPGQQFRQCCPRMRTPTSAFAAARFHGGAQRMTFIRIARLRLRMDDELSAPGVATRRRHGDFDAELVRTMGLAFAIALGLRGDQGLDLRPALALLLIAHPPGAQQDRLQHDLRVNGNIRIFILRPS